MFGFRDTFRYFQCHSCGCLQIAEIPENLDRYYPPEYYAFSPVRRESILHRFKRILALKRNEAAIFHRGLVGRLLNKLFPMAAGSISWVNGQIGLRRMGKRPWSFKSKILDVGCGNGASLYSLSQLGFKKLLGADPFITSDIVYRPHLRILKKTIRDIDERFDIITLHHSFEHMPDPLEVLRTVHRALSDDGLCLIRIPVVSSYAWEKYRTYWVQLDAPRHLFLHSVRSMEVLAAQAGFEVEEIIWDSTEFQFWGSEQYLRDIPLMDDVSYAKQPSESIFSAHEIEDFRIKANELNLVGRGDQAAFYLSRARSVREIARG